MPPYAHNREGLHPAAVEITPRGAVAYGGPVRYPTDPRVDAYIAARPPWQREVCQQVGDLVHAADPEVVETIKQS
jgi:hypothetical protein